MKRTALNKLKRIEELLAEISPAARGEHSIVHQKILDPSRLRLRTALGGDCEDTCPACAVEHRAWRNVRRLGPLRRELMRTVARKALAKNEQLAGARPRSSKKDEHEIRRVLAKRLSDKASARELKVSLRTITAYKKKYAQR